MSIPTGLALGAAVSVAVTIAISLLGADLIMREILPQDRIGYCSMAALLSGTILGAVTATNKIKHRKLLICMLSGCIYFCILLASTALFFGGQYEGFAVTLITVLLGSMASALLTSRIGEHSRGHRRKK